MKYLFIDTETTGLTNNQDFSISDIDNWPRLVSIAYILCNERKVINKGYCIIKPYKFIIPLEATKVHGITTAEAVSKGDELPDVLDKIKSMIEECDYIVGHNVAFDINVLNAEFYRYNYTLPVSLKPYYCTMMLSKDTCGLPNNKYPSLYELYTILKGKPISNAHNALIDAQAAMECFWILQDSGIVDCNNKKTTIKIYPTEDNILWAAEHISFDYSAKAYAFLTFACNLIYNSRNIIKSEDDCDTAVEKWLYSSVVTCPKTQDINSEWINSMFKFLEKEIQKEICYVKLNKYYDTRAIMDKPFLRNHPTKIAKEAGSIDFMEEFEKEVGGKEIIQNFNLDYLDSPYATLILQDKSIWVDIAIEAVIKGIKKINEKGNECLTQADAESYLKSMIEYFNEIREKEEIKRINEFNRSLEESFNPKKLKETEEIIKNYSSPYTKSPSGCMLIISVLIGLGSAFCIILAFF